MAIQLVTLPKVIVTTPGQRVPITRTSQFVYSVSIHSLSTNTGYQYVGDKTVSSANGIVFEPSDSAEIEAPQSPKGQEQFDLSQIYLDASVANTEFRISAWTRV